MLGGAVRVRAPGERGWREVPLEALGNDRFGGSFSVDAPGRWQFAVAAWTDRIATWQDELRRKVAAGQEDLAGELAEGAALLGRERVTVEEGLAVASTDRHGEVVSERLEVDVDRVLARFGAWYELFPRSFGGFRGVAAVLPRLAELGFDVVYLPPIHPIGATNRKGPNNALVAGPDDPGSPWAIGSARGRPRRDRSRRSGRGPTSTRWSPRRATAGVELALDFAIQCSPDHPWLNEHPEWFNRRPDGTLKYAENPPKRYQDIYNVNFESEDWRGLWQALLDVVLGWVERGITVFRVDNPHTKPTRVLGVADPGGAPQASGGAVPRRGVHAPVADDDAREARVRAELHVLHVEEHEERAAGVHAAAASRGRSSTGRTRS